MQSHARLCQYPLDSARVPARRVEHRLSSSEADAAARLLPVLCCGEESAVLAFERLQADERFDVAGSACLAQIADEERGHETILHALRCSLPVPPEEKDVSRATRRFYYSLARNGVPEHLSRIYALDSGACIVFRALRDGTIGRDPATAEIFAAIHRDEARHVRHTAHFLRTLGARRDLEDLLAATREELAELTLRQAAAFETLRVDPARLERDLRRIPRHWT